MAQMTNYQVFPIHKGTFKGVPTDKATNELYQLVMAEVAGDVTFTFEDTTDITITMVAGQTFAVNRDCVSITSTISVVMS